ncbi:MAG TPA: PHP-associated domain-containing protein, partial [Dehalococcoidia bacterium]|nr:PHP-associated domain-containing protein [Dehalococcoidia bacterium]
VVAHPFHHHFDPVHFRRNGLKPFDLTPEQAAELPVFKLVDDVEVSNSCNTPRENVFALKVARILGKPGFAGSDAHSRTGIGSSAVMFEKQLSSVDEFLAELHAGRYRPTQGLHVDSFRLFEDIAREFEESAAAAS